MNPPSGSGFSSAIAYSQNISSNTTLNFILTPTGTVTLRGHIYDALGHPLANQTVQLQGSSQTTTDASGSYLLQASAGTYNFIIENTNNSSSLNAPQDYTITASNYSLTQDTTLDITFPLKKVSVHVQDASGTAVSRVRIDVPLLDYANYQLSLGGGITNASVLNGYTPGPTTDTSGNAVSWLFPDDTGHSYTFTATPPTGSIYSQFTLQNIKVIGDQTDLISLQYNHVTPTTTISLLPAPNLNGTYTDPVTVKLSATAASGYTVAYTYYTIDNGSKQTYSSPFTVTGSGSHTITYWSVDNSGVIESAHTKTFSEVSSPMITYYTSNNGSSFSRSSTPYASGLTTQMVNSDGSVTISVNNAPGYADSGIVLYEGTLGNLPDFTVNGTGDHFGLNLWFDTNNNNEYFAWDENNVLTSLDGDTYGLSTGSTNGVLTVNDTTQFFMMSDGQNHSLSDLKNGTVSGITANTKVSIWIGVNTTSSGGSISSTITSISGL